MARVIINCTCATCGETFEHRHECYNRKDAESYTTWAKDHIDECPKCRAARTAREEAEKRAAFTADFPALTGTPKQIAWAEEIRYKAMKSLLDALNANTRKAAKMLLANRTEAKWWIDHRDSRTANDTLRAFAIEWNAQHAK